jgi:hypothetical protein
VATDHLFAKAHTRIREHDCFGSGDQAFCFKPLHHFADRWAADLQPFGNARLDDVEVVFLQFEDALAILLERWMMFTRTGHDHECTEVSAGSLDEPIDQADSGRCCFRPWTSWGCRDGLMADVCRSIALGRKDVVRRRQLG